jgi:hypothetical protein
MSSCPDNPCGVVVVRGNKRLGTQYVKITYGEAKVPALRPIRRLLIGPSQAVVDAFEEKYPLTPAPSRTKNSSKSGRGDVITLKVDARTKETVVQDFEENMFIGITEIAKTSCPAGDPPPVCERPGVIMYAADIFEFNEKNRKQIASLFL